MQSGEVERKNAGSKTLPVSLNAGGSHPKITFAAVYRLLCDFACDKPVQRIWW
jgi:hypothetical protein